MIHKALSHIHLIGAWQRPHKGSRIGKFTPILQTTRLLGLPAQRVTPAIWLGKPNLQVLLHTSLPVTNSNPNLDNLMFEGFLTFTSFYFFSHRLSSNPDHLSYKQGNAPST